MSCLKNNTLGNIIAMKKIKGKRNSVFLRAKRHLFSGSFDDVDCATVQRAL
jgi:sigma54-dependent transcription regulator